MHMLMWSKNHPERTKGYVKVEFLESDEKHDYTEQTLISLGTEVEHLIQSGIKLNDIAILVRKNKSIPALLITLTNNCIIRLCLTKPSGLTLHLPSA